MSAMRWFLLACAVAVGALPAAAWDEDYRHGRVRYADPGVVLQRASESSAEEASPNVPFLPGDRVWTDGGGRAEFQFADGSVLRLDSRSKLDYVAHEENGGERLVLRLWAGRLQFSSRDRSAAEVEIETPAGYVVAREGGSFRVEADAGGTQLSVFEGGADLESNRRRVSVDAGERSWARRGDTPETPQRFDRRDGDDFASWCEEREDRAAWAGNSERYLPDEIDPYASELESHGSWYFVAEVGQVWRPYVDAGWSPYTNGRWIWTSYGWTWVPQESWGWAPSHYGRWGHSSSVGWYWIPGASWGPAWVSWAVGNDYVGWCPLGRGDRPVNLGHAVARGSAGSSRDGAPWVYSRRNELASRDLARRRTSPPAEAVRNLHVVESARARPSRDLRVIDVDTPGRREGAVPRNIRLKPSAGDTVPELREDPATMIPGYAVRHPRPDSRYSERPAASRQDRDVETDAPEVRASRRSSERRDGNVDAGNGAAPPSERAAPRPPTWSDRSSERAERPQPAATPRPRDNEPDRDVLRRIFRPLTETRSAEPRTAPPRSTPPPRAEPRAEPRRTPQPPPPTQQPRSAPRAKERDHHP
jgi:hypothetical protein